MSENFWTPSNQFCFSMYISLTLDTKCTLIQALISLVRIIRMLSPRMTHFNSSFGVIYFFYFVCLVLCRRVDTTALQRWRRRCYGGAAAAMAPASAARPLDEVARSAYEVCSVFWVRPKSTMECKFLDSPKITIRCVSSVETKYRLS